MIMDHDKSSILYRILFEATKKYDLNKLLETVSNTLLPVEIGDESFDVVMLKLHYNNARYHVMQYAFHKDFVLRTEIGFVNGKFTIRYIETTSADNDEALLKFMMLNQENVSDDDD